MFSEGSIAGGCPRSYDIVPPASRPANRRDAGKERLMILNFLLMADQAILLLIRFFTCELHFHHCRRHQRAKVISSAK
jgi:hypothetical protein